MGRLSFKNRLFCKLGLIAGLIAATAYADESRTGGARVIENPTQDGNLVLRVNDGGVKKDAITIVGSTGAVTLTDGMKLDDAAGQTTLNYYAEDDSVSTTFTFNGSGGTSASTTIRCTRIGRLVALSVETMPTATTGTGSTAYTSNTAMPVGCRPTSSVAAPVSARQGGLNLDTGYFSINTSGIITVIKTTEGAAWTNGAPDSGSSAIFVTYRK